MMTISTLSSKNQTTLSMEFVRQLKLQPGTRFKQTVRKGKIILQPVPDLSTAFGALKSKRKFISVEAETTGMEKAIGKRLGAKDRNR
jgi:bifunctional DNA-binding transcriptional regulator/antitoxin component of YhaV-PrlF toxin-antitoxin module